MDASERQELLTSIGWVLVAREDDVEVVMDIFGEEQAQLAHFNAFWYGCWYEQEVARRADGRVIDSMIVRLHAPTSRTRKSARRRAQAGRRAARKKR